MNRQWATRDKLRRQAEAMEEPRLLREAIKRQIWIEGMTIVDFAKMMRMNPHWLKRRLSGTDVRKMSPTLLNKIIAALDVTPRTGRTWHRMGAIEAGWVFERGRK